MRSRKTALCLAVMILFAFSLAVAPVPACAAGDGAKIRCVPQTGVDPDDNPQDLGYIKISQIEYADQVYIEIVLPEGVEWDNPIDEDNVGDYILLYDEDGDPIDNGELIEGSETEYTVMFDDPAMFEEDAYIKAYFEDMNVEHDAPEVIRPTVVVRGVEDGMRTWTAACVEPEVSVQAASPKTVTVGSDQSIANITFQEEEDDSLAAGDKFVLELPSGYTWDEGDITDGEAGLEATASISGRKLTVKITDNSSEADRIVLKASINVPASAVAGDVKVEVSADLDTALFDDKTLVVAKVDVSPLKTTMSIGSNIMIVNGSTYPMDVSPYIKNERTYFPLRYLAYALGAQEKDVVWNPLSREAIISLNGEVLRVPVGSQTIYVNGNPIIMDVSAEIADGRTMLPIRFVAEAFGATVSWDGANRTVTMVLQR